MSSYGPFRVRSGTGAYADTLKTPTGGGTATSLYAVELLERRGGTPTLRDGCAPSIRAGTRNAGVLVELGHRSSNGSPVRGSTSPSLSSDPHIGLLEDGRAVRRLTPLECERLQGFPDGWSAGYSDRARYTMIGDAVMVPVAEYLGRRIAEADRR